MNTNTRAGWMDAGVAEGALEKFLTLNTPQKLVLLPAGHPQNEFVNPFGENSPEYPGAERTGEGRFLRVFRPASERDRGGEGGAPDHLFHLRREHLEGNRGLASGGDRQRDLVSGAGEWIGPYTGRP